MDVREEERFGWLCGALFGAAALFVWITIRILSYSPSRFQDLYACVVIAGVSLAFAYLLRGCFRQMHARHRRYIKPMEEAMWDQTLLVKGLTKRIDAYKDARDSIVHRLCMGLNDPLRRLEQSMDAVLHRTHAALPPADVRSIHEMQEASHTITHTIAKLLTLFDIQDGRAVLQKQSIDPVVLVRSLYAAMRSRMGRKGINFRLVLPKRSSTDIMVDRTKIRECIEHLLENAWHHTEQGGKITLELAVRKGMVRLSVTDTGVGMSRAEAETIWQKPPSSGAGLRIVKYFVEAHGGTVGCTSTLGKGSTFWMELPDQSS